MQRMSALDASFLEFEGAVTHVHIGSVAMLEGPPPGYDELREAVLGKLSQVPRYRRLVRFVALEAGRPVWVDDRHFNLDYHLRRTALPAPGGDAELRRLVGREAAAGEVLTSLSGFAPPLLLALAERTGTRVPQHNINTVTTNGPGPQYPLYAAGRRMLEAFPYVPLGGHVRVGVAIFSYDGALTFGVTGDYDTAPDIDVLCDGIEHDMAKLLDAAGARGGQRRARRSSPGSSRARETAGA